MKLSRKRRRELRHLRGNAEELLHQQRIVLHQAGDVLHEAGRQARKLSDEHLAPRVEATVDAVRPTVDRGVASARRAANTVRRVTTPMVATALAGAIQKLDELEQRDAARQVRTFGERTGFLEPPRKRRKIGKIIALSAGIATAAAVGYAFWQAFRTDDEIWVTSDAE